MNIHLPFDEAWNLQNRAIQQALLLADDPRFNVQIYTSISHALLEVCYSLSELIPHKKTLTHFNNLGPNFDSVAVSLSKRELTLKSFSRDEIAKPEYLISLSKELLMLITSEDDPIVAARYDFSFLEEQLKEKKYFHVRLSNFLHLVEPIRLPTHYEVLVLPLSLDRTLVISGERAKIRPDMTPKMKLDWSAQDSVLKTVMKLSLFEAGRSLHPDQSDQMRLRHKIQRDQILEFESELPAGITPFFKTSDRVFDRSVLLCAGVDGLSMITRLEALISEESMNPLETNSSLETTSLCRWQNSKLFAYLVTQGHKSEALRGLILIEARLLNAKFKAQLTKVHLELLAEQNEILEF